MSGGRQWFRLSSAIRRRTPGPRRAAPETTGDGASVKTYFVYIHDDRYSIPTFQAFESPDDEGVRGHAAERLSSSPHHHAIEVFDEAQSLVFRIER